MILAYFTILIGMILVIAPVLLFQKLFDTVGLQWTQRIAFSMQFTGFILIIMSKFVIIYGVYNV